MSPHHRWSLSCRINFLLFYDFSMTIRTKFYIIITVLGVLFLIQFGLSLQSYRYANLASKTASTRYLSYLIADEFRQSSADLTKFGRAYCATQNEEYDKLYNDILNWRSGNTPRPENVDKDLFPGVKKPQIEIMKELGFTQKELDILGQATALSNELAQYEIQAIGCMKQKKIIDGPMKPQPDETYDRFALRIMYGDEYEIYVAKIGERVDAFFTELETRTASSVQDVEVVLPRIAVTSLIFLAFLITLIVFVFYYLLRVVLSNVNAATVAISHLDTRFLKMSGLIASKLGVGDWRVHFETETDQDFLDTARRLAARPDEIGHLWSSALELSQSYSSIGESLNNVIGHIGTTLREIKSTALDVSNGSGRISSTSDTLTQGASQSAASTEEISATMNEMASQTKKNAHDATEVDSLVREANKSALKCQEMMQGMVDSMEQITKNAMETQKVISVIDGIAFQTNLLALNAAVEAARAGTHGKGFAVVAEEVRNLAARSAKAAAETTQMISQNNVQIQDGAHKASETSDVLSGIVDHIGKVVELVANIAKASEEQAGGVGQVSSGLQQIESVTQQNTATAEESASIAQEMNSSAEQLNQLVNTFQITESK